MGTNNTNNFIVQDIKLLNTYYQNQYGKDWDYHNIENIEPLIQTQFVSALKNKFETLYRDVFENNKIGTNLLLQYIKNGWNLQIKKSEIKQLQTLGAFLSYSEMDTSLIINNALNELHKTTNIDTKNIRYVLDQKQTSNKTQTTSKHKLILLPLLNIAIKSELKKINSTFGHYGNGDIVHNDDHLQMKTPSVSFAETP